MFQSKFPFKDNKVLSYFITLDCHHCTEMGGAVSHLNVSLLRRKVIRREGGMRGGGTVTIRQ